jgi:putative transposase
MPNHTHLIAVPQSEESLRRAIGEAHRRYTRMINFREQWRGHLWQGRLGSFVMDGAYLPACARYVERNPVRAGLCGRPEEYLWSSAKAHVQGEDDILVRVRPLLAMIPQWSAHLAVEADTETVQRLKRHEGTGRPLGGEKFVKKLESLVSRILRPRKPGRKPKQRKK